MKRRALLSTSGFLAAMAVAGCTDASDPTPTATDATTDPAQPPETATDGTPEPTTTDQTTTDQETVRPRSDNVVLDHEPTAGPRAENERLAELVAGNAGFALDLHRSLTDESTNVFTSPYSASVALAMPYAGSGGTTREEMRETLGFPADPHAGYDTLREQLAERATASGPGSDEAVEVLDLRLANALWGREGMDFDAQFLGTLDEHYGAGLRRAAFAESPEAERQRINEWVADNTGDEITELLPRRAITSQTALVLANAIYFGANWDHQFDPERTTEGEVTALDGTTSSAKLMRQELTTNYVATPSVEALELPYSGGQVSMVFLAPREGDLPALEQSLTPERLFGLFDQLQRSQGRLVLPRFEFRTKAQLSEQLSAMGMPSAFRVGADFSGMTPGDSGGLVLDEVYHEAFVSVDEEGTEAAASTASVVLTSMPPSFGEFRLDRPFLFCIRDRPTDAVLFLGRVGDAGRAQ